MNNDNNYQEPNNYQQSSFSDNNYYSQEQSFSGVDNSYSNTFNEQNLGEVPEPNKRPGCLTSFLGFILTIVLMVTLSAGLILFSIKSSLSSGLGVFIDSIENLVYDEISNNTELNEALDLVDSEFSDFIPEEMLDDVKDSFDDAINNGIDADNLPKLDYDQLSDNMYEVSEKVVEETLDYYVEAIKTGEMSEEGKLLDEFLVDVIGYDLQSEYLNTLNSYDTDNYTVDVYEKAKKDTLNVALSGVREEIDVLVYNNIKPAYEDACEEIIDPDMRQLIDYFNMIPMIMKGLLIASAVIILIQLIMYKQKYRALRNVSVVTFFLTLLFGASCAILNAAITEVKKDYTDDSSLAYMVDVIEGFVSPFFKITAVLLVAFVVLFIAQLVMRSNTKKKYM